MKNRVVNTSREAEENPLITMAKTMGVGGIEASEKAGQIQFVESDVLPAEMRCYRSERPARELLESWGFVFGEPIANDPLFIAAKLPPGWRKQTTGHSMWSHIVDERGRERCAVFYKAAFYDRKATLNVSARFIATAEFNGEGLSSPTRGVVTDGGRKVFEGRWYQDHADRTEAEKRAALALQRLGDEIHGARGDVAKIRDLLSVVLP